MALDTFDNLKASVKSWSKRKDVTGALVSDFVVLAEEMMFSNRMEPLSLSDMDTRSIATTSTSERFIALPEFFLSMRRLKLNLSQGDRKLTFVTPNNLSTVPTAGMPSAFTVTSQIGFDRVPDQEYTVEMQYFRRPTPLSTSNQTNIILTNFPSIYLNGCLSALWKFFKEEELASYYEVLFMSAIEGANLRDSQGRYGPNPASLLDEAALYP